MDLEILLGLTGNGEASPSVRQQRFRQVNLQLLASGLAGIADGDAQFTAVAKTVLDSFRVQARLLSEHRCPADQRITSSVLRAAVENISRVNPLMIRLIPRMVPIAQTELAGHGRQIM